MVILLSKFPIETKYGIIGLKGLKWGNMNKAYIPLEHEPLRVGLVCVTLPRRRVSSVVEHSSAN